MSEQVITQSGLQGIFPIGLFANFLLNYDL